MEVTATVQDQRKEQKENEKFRNLQVQVLTAQIEGMLEQLKFQKLNLAPAINWQFSETDGGGALIFKFINKGGRFRITKLVLLDKNAISARFSPRRFVGNDEEGRIIFDPGQFVPLNVSFELHYDTMDGSDFIRYQIENGRMPVERP